MLNILLAKHYQEIVNRIADILTLDGFVISFGKI
jgi:hypothetical protein